MNAKTVEMPSKRFSSTDNKSLGIQNYGDNNLYPEELKLILKSSSTAKGCSDEYKRFIFGDGFMNAALGNKVCNRKGQTFNDVAELCANDLGDNRGYAYHVNYNIEGRVWEVNHVPFESCRLGLADAEGHVDKIGVFPDWTGTKMFGGKRLKPSKETIIWMDRFNPDNVIHEIPESGISDYNGQLYWYSADGHNTYPTPKYDAAITEISTDEGLSNISYRSVRNGFFSAGLMVTKKGSNTEDDRDLSSRITDADSFEYQVAQLQGDQNTNLMLSVEVESDEEIPQHIPLKSENYDKEFDVTNRNTIERIYAAFSQEVFYRIRFGSFGFSSDMLSEAYNYYSGITDKERGQLERGFANILPHWKEPMEGVNSKIKPLTYTPVNGGQTNQYNGFKK